jgi:hypothetical protein
MIKYDRSGIRMFSDKALGSKKNKFAILGVAAPSRQDTKTKEYPEYSKFSQRSRAGCIDV